MNYKNLTQLGLLQTEEIISTSEKVFIVDEVFAILKDAYKDVKGGLHFICEDDLISKTDLWRVIYLDENIVGVIIYKAKQGLKMVALGIANISRTTKLFVKTMLTSIFNLTFNTSWMEVSESVERFILNIGGDMFFINNSLAGKLIGKDIVSLDANGYHYKREILGVVKTKVMIGTVKFN